MGGYVAFEIIRQAPERVTRLALLDTRASGDTPDDKERRQRLITLAEQGRFDDVHGVLWQRLVHPDRLSDKPLERVVKGMMVATGPDAFIRQQKAVIGRSDYQAMLSAINVPTLIIVGEDDQITPPDYARAIAAAITGAQLLTVPACGHLSSLEQPDIVNAALANWLRLAMARSRLFLAYDNARIKPGAVTAFGDRAGRAHINIAAFPCLRACCRSSEGAKCPAL